MFMALFDNKTHLPTIPYTFYSGLAFRNPIDNSSLELSVEVDKDEGLDAAVDEGQGVGRKEGDKGGELCNPCHDEDHAEWADADHEEGSEGNHLDCYPHHQPGKG